MVKKTATKVIEKKKAKTPTQYSKELAIAITDDLAFMTILKACEKHGISERTYYNWLHKKEEVVQLSTQARATKGIYHFNRAQEVNQELADMKYSNKYDGAESKFEQNKKKLVFENELRLAGKANQGLFGDKGTIINNNTQINNIIQDSNESLSQSLLDAIDINKPKEIK